MGLVSKITSACELAFFGQKSTILPQPGHKSHWAVTCAHAVGSAIDLTWLQ